jgi:hypothetical protein
VTRIVVLVDGKVRKGYRVFEEPLKVLVQPEFTAPQCEDLNMWARPCFVFKLDHVRVQYNRSVYYYVRS